jgi:hypothetical protein
MNKLDNITTTIKEDLTNSFDGLVFDEDNHIYTYNGKRLKSTTSIVDSFKEHFDTHKAAENKAKKILEKNPNDYRTAEYYKKRWNYIRDEATNKGSRVHMYAECYPNFDEPYCDKEKGVLEFFNEFLPKNYHLVLQEFRMYDEKMLLAGTTDGILYDSDKNHLILFDFKTNNKNLFKYEKNLLGTMSNLKDTSYNLYSIQLSHYKYMLEQKTKYKVSHGLIVWLNNEVYNDKKVSKVKPLWEGKYCKVYKAKNLIKPLLNHFNNQNKAKGLSKLVINK